MATEAVKTNEPAKKPAAGEPIAIKALHFNRPNGISVPGTNDQLQKISAGDGHRGDFEIVLLPWLRQYKVTLKRDKAKVTFLVPETWAIAETFE